MAYDKVVDSSALDSKLTAIANAIRAKTGSTGTLTLDQMPTEIAGIETETEITLQNKEITANGTYAADTGYDGLGQVTVNVASGGGSESDGIDIMLTGTFTEIDSSVATIRDYACRAIKTLETVTIPEATRIGSYAFHGCTALTSIYSPLVTYLGPGAFYGCTVLAEISLPLITSVPGSCFYGCTSLVTADFANASKITASNTFQNATSLEALILRKTDAVATLGNTNIFTGSTIENGTGFVYVPRALVDTYKAATNWSTYADQFRALEDYTVDGTTTGALDESKI